MEAAEISLEKAETTGVERQADATIVASLAGTWPLSIHRDRCQSVPTAERERVISLQSVRSAKPLSRTS